MASFVPMCLTSVRLNMGFVMNNDVMYSVMITQQEMTKYNRFITLLRSLGVNIYNDQGVAIYSFYLIQRDVCWWAKYIKIWV